MEKFAVDLEKVLDEFEYNEEREENVPTLPKHHTLPHSDIGALRQVAPAKPPAVSYRRPSFEPINLADADFAASPPKPTSNFNSKPPGKPFSLLGNNKNYVRATDNIVSSLNNEVNINKQIIIEPDDTAVNIWQKGNTGVSGDEKPDLLEYNSTNPDFDSNGEDYQSQLPDLTTSVRAAGLCNNNYNIDSLSNSLDLISSASVNLLKENEQVKHDLVDCEGDNLYRDYDGPNSQFYQDSRDESNLNNDLAEFAEALQSKIIPEIDSDRQVEFETSDKAQALNLVQDVLSEKTDFITGKILEESSIGEAFEESQIPIGDKEVADESPRLQEEAFEIPKAVGFFVDSDVSEGDLEEYLKELEDLDETALLGRPMESNATSNTEGVNSCCESTCEDQVELNLNGSKILSNICMENKISDHDSSIAEYEVDNSYRTNNTSSQIIDPGLKDHDKNYPENDIHHLLKTDTHSSVDAISLEKNCLPQNTTSSSVYSQEINNIVSLDFKFENDLVETSVNIVMDEDLSQPSSNTLTDSNCENSSVKPTSNKDGNRVITVVPEFSNSFEVEGKDGKTESTGHERTTSTNPFEDEDGDNTINEEKLKMQSTNPFDEEVDEGFSREESVSELSVEPMLQICPQHPGEVCEAERASLDPNAGQDTTLTTELNTTSEIGTEVTVCSVNTDEPQDPPSYSDVIKASGSSFSSSRVEVGETAAALSLPGCSGYKSLESLAKMIPVKAAVESPSMEGVDEAGVPAEEDRPLRPSSLELQRKITVETSLAPSPDLSGEAVEREPGPEERRLGKVAPFWVPDTDTTMCMQCQVKFSVLKRRHHCRACGQVLCSKCCDKKFRLEYMNFAEARVCQSCYTILEALSETEDAGPPRRQPNPNNPMEYCSTIPPLQQAAGSMHQPPPSVMVPVGVLKREGRVKSDVTKQVMFSDGIRPGGDLTELDGSGDQPRLPFRRPGRVTKRVGTPPGGTLSPTLRRVMDPSTHSFIPADGDTALPPIVLRLQGEVSYSDWESPINLDQPPLKFALNRNLFVVVKRVLLECCVNRECWCFSSEGLACVGQDEVVFLLECLPQEAVPPKDVFLLINLLYQDAAKGSTVSEMSFTPAQSNNLLGSRDHGGFLYIRTSFQCTAQLVLPSPPYLIALLIHRWETPWARLFPIRLVLRLGAEFRYYPCPLVSVRNRPPLYTDIGQTIINLLADFRKYSYSLPSVRSLVIHMEDRQTTINIPRNRYDQVVRALNNSNDSVLAFGANLSLAADSHLVCMQSTEDAHSSYHTQAINIHNKPRRVTGASFVVFNGALKTPGLTGKSNIVEDGLMVQVPGETMVALRTALRDMKDYSVGCGPNAEETVVLQWTADDTNFNIGVKSCIDGKPLDGVPSIRVHNGTDYTGGTRIIRWTEVFILQCEDSEHSSEPPLDISRLSESIARASCLALVPLLDLLTAASLTTLAVRTTIHPDNVGYEAGSNGEKLPPLYMKCLDDELVAVVHQAALSSQENPAVLELVFRVMEQG